MPFNSNWNRRGFLSTLGIIAAAGFSPFKLAAKKSPASAAGRVSGFGQTGNPYQELGGPTVINGEGTMTMLGDSLPIRNSKRS